VTEASCHNCIYAFWDPCQWMASLWSGFPSRPTCANHPDSLGRTRPTPGGPVCRNYRPNPPEPDKGAKRIPLSDGFYAYVDAADYEWLSQWAWHLQDGYAVRWDHGKKIYMHRQIMQPPEGMVVDHINRNRADNCRSNLRVCTRDENMCNRVKRAGSISRFKGVGYRKRNHRWYAELVYEGEPVWFSFFESEIEAARAYDYAAVQRFGPFANLNLPEEWPPERRQEVHAQWQAERAKLQDEGRRQGRESSLRDTGPQSAKMKGKGKKPRRKEDARGRPR
jgi:hypothetical protein